MRGLGAAVALGLWGSLCSGAPPSEPKGDVGVHGPKGHGEDHDGDIAVVQPVAILMDNGDVVPLPVMGMEDAVQEEDVMMGDVEAAAAGYGAGFQDYPQMYYGAYPPQAPYGFEGPDGAVGRQMTQKGYGPYGARYGYDGGVYGDGMGMMGRPMAGKQMMGKGWMGKGGYGGYGGKAGWMNKGFLAKGGYPIAEMDRPIIEQPIYRPAIPAARPYYPDVQPLYDTRIRYGPSYGTQLPSHITCPTGMKCSAKQYYVPASRPAYRPMGPKPSKYLKKAGYAAKKYRY